MSTGQEICKYAENSHCEEALRRSNLARGTREIASSKIPRNDSPCNDSPLVRRTSGIFFLTELLDQYVNTL